MTLKQRHVYVVTPSGNDACAELEGWVTEVKNESCRRRQYHRERRVGMMQQKMLGEW